jgi:hypothetical protein
MAETSRRADDDFLVPITGVIAGSYGVMQPLEKFPILRVRLGDTTIRKSVLKIAIALPQLVQ